MSTEETYHPLDMNDSPSSWMLCHYLLGSNIYTQDTLPHTLTNDMLPDWYLQLSDDLKEGIWQEQERYFSELLSWFTEKGIVDAFISEPEGDALPSSLNKTGHLIWDASYSEIVPRITFFNLYLKAEDGSILIAYESDTETIFLHNTSGKLPAVLTKPAAAVI